MADPARRPVAHSPIRKRCPQHGVTKPQKISCVLRCARDTLQAVLVKIEPKMIIAQWT